MGMRPILLHYNYDSTNPEKSQLAHGNFLSKKMVGDRMMRGAKNSCILVYMCTCIQVYTSVNAPQGGGKGSEK